MLPKGNAGMPRPTSFDGVLPKGDVGMPRPTSFYRLCFQKEIMACNADVVRPCVLPKGDDGMPRSSSFDRVCCPKAVMACHARRFLTVYVVLER